MKFRAVLASSVLLATANAATVLTSNDPGASAAAGGNAFAVFGVDGVTAIPAGTGFVGIGYFSTTPDFGASTGAAIEAAFSQLGGSGTMGVSYSGQAADGIFAFSASDTIASGGVNSDFIGQDAFLVIGDGSSIANSGGLLIIQSGSFAADPGGDFDILVDGGLGGGQTLAYGFNDVNGGQINVGTAGAFGTSNGSFRLAQVVPEPSVILLGALGMIGMLRRRR